MFENIPRSQPVTPPSKIQALVPSQISKCSSDERRDGYTALLVLQVLVNGDEPVKPGRRCSLFLSGAGGVAILARLSAIQYS